MTDRPMLTTMDIADSCHNTQKPTSAECQLLRFHQREGGQTSSPPHVYQTASKLDRLEFSHIVDQVLSCI